MKVLVEFKSSAFPAREDEEEEINPGRFGMALAEFLAKEVSKKGFKADVGGYEDWGVQVYVENEEFPVWIGCGNVDNSENEFIVFVEPNKPEIKKGFFKKKIINCRPIIEKLTHSIDEILNAHDAVSEINWESSD